MTEQEPGIPAHASFSSLTSYARCPKSWQLERVSRVPQQGGWAGIGGSAVHTATERHDYGLDTDARELFDTAFEEHIKQAYEKDPDITNWRASGRASKDWPDKENDLWWYQNGPKLVQAWIDWRTTGNGRVYDIACLYGDEPAIELELYPIIGGMRVKMFIDRLKVMPNGELLVVDLKTGSFPADPLQLGFYAEGVYQEAGVRPAFGLFWNARKGDGELVDLSPYTEAYLGHLVESWRKGIANEIFLPSRSNMCKSCFVRRACAAYGGEQAEQFDPDYFLMRGIANV